MLLKELREKSGYNRQKEFAVALGQKISTVSMWETGRSVPKTTDLPKIAKVLNVPVEQVLACFTKDADGEHKGEAV